MRIELLEYFVNTIQYGSINKAARELFIAQSSLSEALLSLEKELGFQLLERSNRGIRPTIAGARVYEDALKILKLVECWGEFAGGGPQELAGEVHLLATPSICSVIIKPLLIQLQERYPKLKLLLHETKNQLLLSTFEKAKYQMAIGFYTPEDEKETVFFIQKNGWHREILFKDIFQIVMNRNSVQAERGFLKKEELQGLAFAQYSDPDDKVSSKYFAHLFCQDKIYRLNSKEAILQTVAEGKAVAVFSGLLMKNDFYYKMNLVKLLTLEDYSLPVTYYIIYNTKNVSDQLISMLVAQVRAAVNSFAES
ncbi:MAG: LysR family transcriptional regulator [Peptococcaceae bacterium]